MTPHPWRTVLTVLAVCVMQLAAFAWMSHAGWTESAANAYASLCMWTTIAATGQAAKGTVEALAQGTGVAGARAALFTAAKPGEPAPQEP